MPEGSGIEPHSEQRRSRSLPSRRALRGEKKKSQYKRLRIDGIRSFALTNAKDIDGELDGKSFATLMRFHQFRMPYS